MIFFARKYLLKSVELFFYFFNNLGGRYFDKGVFCEGDGLDIPLGHPALDFLNNNPNNEEYLDPFGFERFPSAQDVADIVFNINNTDSGNNGRVPHLFMTFGQLMDHDFAYVLHPSGSSSGCKARYVITMIDNEILSSEILVLSVHFSEKDGVNG